MKPKKDMKEVFREYRVHADSIEEFLNKYTKPRSHGERGEEYVQDRIQFHKERLSNYGYTFITRHDSITGDNVSYYG